MKMFLRLSIITISIAMVSFGIYRGEVTEVLRKAINICLECIGIG